MKIPTRLSLEEQCKKQEIVPAEGETIIRWNDLLTMQSALKMLANKAIVKDHRLHIIKCLRVVNTAVEDFTAAVATMTATIPPEEIASAGQSDGVVSSKVIQLNRDIAELRQQVTTIKLPSVITEAMLPKNDKDHPQNEDNLTAILDDLGPLFPIPE